MIIKLLKPFLVFVLASLFALSLSRLGMVLWQFDRVVAVDGLAFVLLQGVRYDLILLGMILLIPLVISPWVTFVRVLQKPWNFLLRIYFTAWFITLVFIELSSPSFIMQFDLRPNYLFVEYLKYPKEVISTLWAAYKIPLILSVVLTALAGVFIYRKLKPYQVDEIKLSIPVAAISSVVFLLVCVMMARSTFDHRPVNPSVAAFSNDPLINTLPLSSTYSVLYAIYDEKHHDSDGFAYGDISDEEVVASIKANMRVDEALFVSDEFPTLHKQTAYIQRERPLNLVIILEESLGNEYVGALGGIPVTPYLDELSKEGIWFENMFATGTRSVRGIEAITTGFTPTPSRSVVKLNRAQRDFFTIAQLLSQQNYDTSFVYGGEAHFDNMRGFFANNGFNRIYDENDYDDPIFYGSWGASDEDLFNKAHSIFEEYSEDQPFFSLVFTSSNHPPYEFPDGRIELEGDEKNTVNNAVKYADYALGQFIEKARNSKYWENTLFVIVADHCDRVYGPELVPVQHFRIPALIMGADISPAHYKPVASQIDLLPTTLSLIGINSEHPAIGYDLAENIITNSDEQGRAIMQFAKTAAYMEGEQVVVMQKNLPVQAFVYKNNTLLPAQGRDDAFVQRALAYAKWPVIAYQNGLYQLPK